MKPALRGHGIRTLFAVIVPLLAAAVARAQAPAQGDEEVRQTVARVSFLGGSVSYVRGDDPDNWQPADTNVPLTVGDRLYTGDDGRAELQVHGGFAVRVGAQADLAALNLTDDTKQWSLRSGAAAFQLKRLAENEVFEVDTPNGAVTFERPGDYRLDVDGDGNTRIAVREGRAFVAAGGGQVPLNAGEQMNLEGTESPRYDVVQAAAPDAFDGWVRDREQRSERARSRQYVHADVVGAADLDEHGRWENVPSYGWVWTPTVVEAGWQPYRAGHWIWQDPWGWTWVAAEPWGWAPYHYGRWVQWSSRWWWVPVARAVRVVHYAPALVAFCGGGPGWSPSVTVAAGGFIGWFPLAPRDPFIHWWGRSRMYNVERVNYVNRTYITVVDRGAFVSGDVVTTRWVRDPAVVRTVVAAPVLRGPLPLVPAPGALHVAVRPGLPPVVRPPVAVASRQVVVRVAPPPPPPTFQTKVAVIQKNKGAPIGAATAARIVEADRGTARPALYRPVATESGRVNLTPKSADARIPRAEPATPARTRPSATGSTNTTGSATGGSTGAGTGDRGRKDDGRRDRTTSKSGQTGTGTGSSTTTTDRGRAPDTGKAQPRPTPSTARTREADTGRPTPVPARPTPRTRQETQERPRPAATRPPTRTGDQGQKEQKAEPARQSPERSREKPKEQPREKPKEKPTPHGG